MSDDHHADARDRQRHKRRYGPTTTNPGMRIVMRELAQKDKDKEDESEGPAVKGRRRVPIERRRRSS